VAAYWSVVLLLVLLLGLAIAPVVQTYRLERARMRCLRRIERQRSSRVITLIHRQESRSVLGIPISRYIDIEDAEQVMRAIRLTPRDMPIDLILHTPGGLVLATQQIARALANHPARVTVIVPHHAMSGGTLLALAADEILVDANAVMGPVDPEVGGFPAVSLLSVVAERPRQELDDETLLLANVARTAMAQIQELIQTLVADRMAPEQVKVLVTSLTEGRWTHDYPIAPAQARALGLNVTVGVPDEVYALMDLYPPPRRTRPAVQYVPIHEEEVGELTARRRVHRGG
jgi:ClpP class serine protease